MDMDRQHRNETVVSQFGRRLGAASGLLSIALLSVGSDVLGGNSAGILVELFGFAFFLFFLGSLWACLRNAEGAGGWLSATAFGAGVAEFAVKLGSGAPLLATMANKGMDPEIARALIAINDASFLLTFLPLAVMLSATAVVAIRWGALPRWLGWMAAVTALGLLGGLGRGSRSLRSVGGCSHAVVCAVDRGDKHRPDPARGRASPGRNRASGR